MKLREYSVLLQHLLSGKDIKIPEERIIPNMENLIWLSENLSLTNKPSPKLTKVLNIINIMKAKMLLNK